MSQLQSRLAGYLDALDDPTVLDAVVSWVSNGERGHLHALRRCYRLSKKANIVQHQLTLHDAVKRTCCEACFDHAITPMVPALRELQHVIHVHGSITRMMAELSKATALPQIHRAIRDIDTAITMLNSVHARAQEHGFVKRHDSTRASLGKLRNEATAALTTHRTQIISMTAAELLQIENSREIPQRVGSPEEDRLFGGDRSYSFHLSRLYQAWLSKISGSTAYPDTVIEQTLTSYRFQSPSQLEGLAFGGSTDNLAKAVEQRWSEEIRIVADRLITRWTTQYEQMLTDDAPELVAVQLRRIPSGELAQLVLSCHTLARNDELEVAFLEVPGLVARWLVKESNNNGRYGSDNPAVHRLGSRTVDGNTVDTAARLWDPRSDTYRDPSVCLQAAAALHH